MHAAFDLTPDGRHVVLATFEEELYWFDNVKGKATLVSVAADRRDPEVVWGPEGRSIAYAARGKTRRVLRQKLEGGDPEVLVEGPFSPEHWSRDGRRLALIETDARRARILTVSDSEAPTGLSEDFERLAGLRFSPDGNFIAYAALRTDRWDVYVSRVPPTEERWQISIDGGVQPRWRGDGKELYYLALDGAVMAADMKLGARAESSAPRPLFRAPLRPGWLNEFAVSDDGQRFLFDVPVYTPTTDYIHIVLNWGLSEPR